MTIKFKSTRGDSKLFEASEAILKGIASDGGLFIPTKIPKIDFDLEEILKFDYKKLAYEILKLILTDFTKDELEYCINNAYDEKFDTNLISPLKNINGNYFLELFHGKTLAFKDIALSILPYFMKVSMRKNNINKELVILTATSGDTGKAALEGFADVDKTKIIVFFPKDGVSPVQKAQMVTQTGKNTLVVGVKGNFDDCQTGVKKIFMDNEFVRELDEKGYMLSSANSINIGRLAPQIVYYFSAYAQLVKNGDIFLGEKINFTVPTGNFGNILAGYYAKLMGLPINKLICASNDNKVLFDFFKTGEYNINREFFVTISPSMDILISSNFERFLYTVAESCEKTSVLMSNLNKEGVYTFEMTEKSIVGEYATKYETLSAIKEMYSKNNYIMDTHTAVAFVSYEKYLNGNDDTNKNVILSTASPYKFSKDVLVAIDKKFENTHAFDCLHEISKFENNGIPHELKNIHKKEILHKQVISKNEFKELIQDYLG